MQADFGTDCMRVALSNVGQSHWDAVEQFFGPWAIAEPWARTFLATHDHINMAAPERVQQAVDTGLEMAAEGIALIEIRGMMTKRGSSFSAGGSTIEARRKIRLAANDPSIDAILLKIESPGGTSAGTAELAVDVAEANNQKPVVVFIEDLGASAAYYVASQGRHLFANQSAVVGGIGTYMVVVDSSKMAGEMGIQVHVIKAGEFKAAGQPGTEITDSQLDYFAGIVESLNAEFVAAVERGRYDRMRDVQGVANGKVYTTAEAARNGLIDGVKTFDETVAFTRSLVMSENKKGASLKELRSALVGADSDFLMNLLGDEATLQEAQEAWILELTDRLAKSNEELGHARRAEQDARIQIELLKSADGVPPVGDGDKKPNQADSAKDEWNAAIQRKVAGGMDRKRAVVEVNKNNPGLREAMLAEANG